MPEKTMPEKAVPETEKVKLKDFIELDYTGRLADGTVFDTTKESVAKENHLSAENRQFRPAIICIGEQQLLPGLDAELDGKEVGKEYTLRLPPERAFGKRDIKKMKIIPFSTFREHELEPRPGLQIDVDGEIGVVVRVAGGRIIVNFNHPLAGKEVVYEFKISRKITDPQEQISFFLNSTLRVPTEQIKVEIVEGKAVVELPMLLPPQLTAPLGDKLAELVKLKEVEFKVKERSKKGQNKVSQII